MGWTDPDVYSQPEQFGLTLLREIDLYERCYSFDLVVVWWHEDGTIYWGTDSGCSCPSPFEDITSLDQLHVAPSWSELEAALLALDPNKSTISYISANENYAAEVAEVIYKVRGLQRG